MKYTKQIKHSAKRFILENALLLGAAGVILIFSCFRFIDDQYIKDRAAPIASAVAAVAGFIYFVQKQRLEETSLFQKLFSEFNKQYKELKPPFDETMDSKTIEMYLDLCGEEYLYYSEGYILPIVWKAWCEGMIDNLTKSAALKTKWLDELQEKKGRSYYGLTHEFVTISATR